MLTLVNIPMLPPKEGYIEVVDEFGEHIYQATEQQLVKEQKETDKQIADERIAALEAAIIDLMGVIQSV